MSEEDKIEKIFEKMWRFVILFFYIKYSLSSQFAVLPLSCVL